MKIINDNLHLLGLWKKAMKKGAKTLDFIRGDPIDLGKFRKK